MRLFRIKPKNEFTIEKSTLEDREQHIAEVESETSDDEDKALQSNEYSQDKEGNFKKKIRSRTTFSQQSVKFLLHF